MLGARLLPAALLPLLAGAQQPCTFDRETGVCECGETDLSEYGGRSFTTPADSDGYVYKIQVCSPISLSRLPAGCRPADPAADPHAAVVRYKSADESDCSTVGSFGPCADGNCGMTHELAGETLTVAWSAAGAAPPPSSPFGPPPPPAGGCAASTFQLVLTVGDLSPPTSPPRQFGGQQCSWTLPWASLSGLGEDAAGAHGAAGCPYDKHWIGGACPRVHSRSLVRPDNGCCTGGGRQGQCPSNCPVK